MTVNWFIVPSSTLSALERVMKEFKNENNLECASQASSISLPIKQGKLCGYRCCVRDVRSRSN